MNEPQNNLVGVYLPDWMMEEVLKISREKEWPVTRVCFNLIVRGLSEVLESKSPEKSGEK